MLAALKSIIPWVVYAAMLFLAIYGSLKKPQWSLMLLMVLIPVPALWYPTHAIPLGKDTLDILVLSTFVGTIVTGRRTTSPKGRGIVWFLVLLSFASLVNVLVRFGISLDVGFSFIADWKNYAEMIILYFLAYSALGDEEDQKLALTVVGLVILYMSVQAFRNFDARATFSYDKRASGPFELLGLGANHFAAFLAHYCAVLLGLALIDPDRRRRWLFLGAVGISLHPLLFAYSRGAYAAVFLVLLIVGLVRYRLILVLLLVLAVGWQEILPSSVVERITMTENADGEIEESAALRMVMWDRAEQMFRDNPVFGIGFTGFAYAMRGERLTNTHNYFVQTAAEQGLLGLIALAALFGRALWLGWFAYRRGLSAFHRGLGFGFFTCVLAMLVTNIFGDRYSAMAMGSYFFILMGILERVRDSAGPVTGYAANPRMSLRTEQPGRARTAEPGGKARPQ